MFVSDSLLKGLTEDAGLKLIAAEKGWGLRLKRGGTILNVRGAVKREKGMVNQYKWKVISAGSNHMRRVGEKTEEIRKDIVEPVRESW